MNKILFCTLLLMISCSSAKQFIKIGFIADLTGNNSNLGISARNSLELAISEINETGGLLNRELILVPKNHQGDRELSSQLTVELIEEGVDVILGPITSSMALSVVDSAKDQSTLVLGPTVSTELLSGLDDHFFRVSATSAMQGIYIGDLLNNREYNSVDVVFDERNDVYALGVFNGLKKRSPDILFNEYSYSSDEGVSEVVEELLGSKGEALVFITNGVNGGYIVQELNKNGRVIDLYGTSWVKVSDIVKYAGKGVEDMMLVDTFVSRDPTERELDFRKRYVDSYYVDPNIVSIYFYEAMYLYRDSVLKANSLLYNNVREALKNTGQFEGITENYTIDEFGDGYRKMSIFKIINGNYVIIDEN